MSEHAEDKLVTASGRVLTDADLERLADEAEYDPAIRASVACVVDELLREGKIRQEGDHYVVP